MLFFFFCTFAHFLKLSWGNCHVVAELECDIVLSNVKDLASSPLVCLAAAVCVGLLDCVLCDGSSFYVLQNAVFYHWVKMQAASSACTTLLNKIPKKPPYQLTDIINQLCDCRPTPLGNSQQRLCLILCCVEVSFSIYKHSCLSSHIVSTLTLEPKNHTMLFFSFPSDYLHPLKRLQMVFRKY